MPAGIGYPQGGSQVAALAGGARAKRGIPQQGAVAGGEDVNEIMRNLTSGQVSAEQLMMLLSLLTGSQGVPGQGRAPQPGAAGPPGTGPIQPGQAPGPSPTGRGPAPADPISSALMGGGR